MLIHTHPILFRLLIWIVLPLTLMLSLAYGYLNQSLPQKEGILLVEGLDSQVKIIRDEHAVPHIFADTDHDAFFAMGYLHAQDRLWQMEYKRRLGQGRLSEILGSNGLRTDQFMKTLGLYRVAKLALQSLDDTALQSLMAYVNGVNAWLQEAHTLPVEFYILDFRPEYWQPEDSLLQIKLMALNLGSNYSQELIFDLLIKELGLTKAAELMPNYPSQAVTVTQATGMTDEVLLQGLLALNDQLQRKFHLGGEGLGTNGWVVSGRFTQSGKPLLANDPHLATQMPSAWYLAEIQGDRLHVTGATLPGLPYVVLGHNESIAWGGTSLGADVQDLYLERTNPLDENQYEIEGRWVEMDIDEEWIYVKPGFPRFLTDPIPPLKWQVRRTHHGPLISDAIGRLKRPLALRWTALDMRDKSFQSFLNINYAQDWFTFKLALKDYVAPALNFIYADAQGNIAYIAGGKIPIRQQGDGRLPVPGWQSIYDWHSYIPLKALPQSLNPESGYIVSANNKNHSTDYPYLISHSWSPPYRAERITEAIEAHIQAGRKLVVQDFIELQGDYKSLQAKQLLVFLLQLTSQSSKQKNAIDHLKRWDGVMSEDSVAAAIYQSWLRHFNRLLLHDDLRGDLLHIERGNLLQSFAEQLHPLFINQAINQALDHNKHNWCDRINTTQQETCEILALTALDKAIDELERLVGDNWQWGSIHKTHYPHPVFTHVQLLDSIFDRKIRSGGDSYSVNVAGWVFSQDKGYQQFISPSYRQVIDLSKWNHSGFINNTGQSGNVLSEHYDDYILRHKQLVLLPMHFGVKQGLGKESILLLQPTQ